MVPSFINSLRELVGQMNSSVESRFNGVDYPKKEQMDYLESNIFPATREAGIPDAVPATQWGYESAYGTSQDAKNLNNPFGLGPHNQYGSVGEATKVYINTVLNNSGLGEIDETGKLRLKKGVTAEQLMDALAGKYETHNPDKWKSIKEQKNTPLWRYYNGN